MHKTLQGHLTNTKQSRVNSDAAQVLASSTSTSSSTVVVVVAAAATVVLWDKAVDSNNWEANYWRTNWVHTANGKRTNRVRTPSHKLNLLSAWGAQEACEEDRAWCSGVRVAIGRV